ncbi:MAG: SDR family NAD(P)-dependent oxidoreductase [Acidimicrobiales bacterium]
MLVNNAGVTSAGAFEGERIEDLHWIVDVNVWGVVHGCRAFLPALRAADEAHIVNLSSMVGLLGLPHNASYSLTKGAVRSFSEALRSELVTSNVGLTVVFPEAIHTNITAGARGTEAERLAAMGRSRLAPLLLRSPGSVAGRIVGAIERTGLRVVGPDAHVVSLLSRVLPGRSGLVGRATDRRCAPRAEQEARGRPGLGAAGASQPRKRAAPRPAAVLGGVRQPRGLRVRLPRRIVRLCKSWHLERSSMRCCRARRPWWPSPPDRSPRSPTR